MKPRLYFDTSVFGGVFDEEFQSDTQKLFDMAFYGQIICAYSDMTISELENAPQTVKDYFTNLSKEVLEKVEVAEESNNLAEKYLAEKVAGRTSYNDCLHIATATVNKLTI